LVIYFVEEKLKVISSATKNIRESVKYVKTSQSRKKIFETMIEHVRKQRVEEHSPLICCHSVFEYELLGTSLKIMFVSVCYCSVAATTKQSNKHLSLF